MFLFFYQNIFIGGILTFAVSLSPKLHFLFKINQMMIHILAVQYSGNKFLKDVPSLLSITHIYLLFAIISGL